MRSQNGNRFEERRDFYCSELQPQFWIIKILSISKGSRQFGFGIENP